MVANFTLRRFNELSTLELYSILHLRQLVFVVEQQCIFLDSDGLDLDSYHLMCHHATDNSLLAYCRILPLNIPYQGYISIGRVVNHPEYRGLGYGKRLMSKALECCQTHHAEQPIMIGAQLYLRSFYASFGFEQVGDSYLEDGIEHIKMKKV
jgi:ElaA protein